MAKKSTKKSTKAMTDDPLKYVEKVFASLENLSNDSIANKLYEVREWWIETKPEIALDKDYFDTLVKFSKDDSHVQKAEAAYQLLTTTNPDYIIENANENLEHPLWTFRLLTYETLILHGKDQSAPLNEMFFSTRNEEIQTKWWTIGFYLQEVEKPDLELFEKLRRSKNLIHEIIGAFAFATRNPKTEIDNLKAKIIEGLKSGNEDERSAALYAANFTFLIEDEIVVDKLFDLDAEIRKVIPDYNLFHHADTLEPIKNNFQQKFIGRMKDLNVNIINNLKTIFKIKDKPFLEDLAKSVTDSAKKKCIEDIINSLKDEVIEVDGTELEI